MLNTAHTANTTTPSYKGQPTYRAGDRVRRLGASNGPVGRIVRVAGPYEVVLMWDGTDLDRPYHTSLIGPT